MSAFDEFDAEERESEVDTRTAKAVVASIRKQDTLWTPGKPLDLAAGVSWKPDLYAKSKKRALHVHLSPELPRYVEKRLRAAANDHKLSIALPIEGLYDPKVLRLMGELDAWTYVIDQEGNVSGHRHGLAALGDHGVPVERELRVALGRTAWDRLGEGTSYEKGRRLEGLLAFLLSQVTDFRIFSRNFRNATQEIDIVLQVDKLSGRCWAVIGVPFVLVEAKNLAEPVGQPHVSLLFQKLRTKRGTARIGMLFSPAGFTSDARQEELRGSEGNLCIPMFGAAEIQELIVAEDIDQCLERLVGKAMLR